jgi:hypothetical protein
MGRILSHWLLLALVASAAARMEAGQFLVATHTSGGWTLEEADAIQVNDPSHMGRQGDWPPRGRSTRQLFGDHARSGWHLAGARRIGCLATSAA